MARFIFGRKQDKCSCHSTLLCTYTWGGLSWTCDLATEWAQLLLLTSRSAILSQVKSGLIEPVALSYELIWMEIRRKLPAQAKVGHMIKHTGKKNIRM